MFTLCMFECAARTADQLPTMAASTSATVELGVSELILSSSASTCRRAKVRVMMPSAPSLETPTVAAVGQQPLRFEWSQKISVRPGGREFQALQALEAPAFKPARPAAHE